MGDLHWTGAVLLLALAVLGSGSAQQPRSTILSWADFAREHQLDAEPQPAYHQPVPIRPGPSE